jgi:eukaryotic-like serine/threonine-protein kinase
MWLRPLNSTAAQEVAGTEYGSFPFWSPDGRWIGFFADGKLKKVPVSGGTAQVICDAPVGRGGAWSSKGVVVFTPSIGGPIFRVSDSGGPATPITQLDTSLGETTHRWPSFLPDGVHFLYTARQISDTAPAAVFAGSIDGPMHQKVVDTLTEAYYSAPGYLVFARQATLFAQRFDAASLKLSGDPVQLAQDASVQPNVLRSGFSVSQTGQLVYGSSAVEGDLELIVIDRSGKQVSSLQTTGSHGYVRISPDEKKVAVSESDAANGGSTIWIYDLATRSRTRFSFGPGLNINPVWSPDGSQIALTSSRTGAFNVYAKPSTGSSEDQPMHPGATEDERSESWSSDGKYLVLDSRPQARLNIAEITVLPLFGERKPFHYLDVPYSNFGGQVSQDGHWLAYSTSESGRSEIYVSSFPQAKGKWQVSFNGGQAPRWRKDGRELFYCRADGTLMAVDVTVGKDSVALGATRQVSPRRIYQSVYSAPYDVFADGQHVIMSAVKIEATHAPLTLISNWTSQMKE